MNEINKISVGGTVYNIQDSRITTSSVTTQTQATKFLRQDGTWAAPSYTANDGDTKYYMTLNGSVTGTSGGTNLGTIYAPTAVGTSGQYLKSNGSGAPTWATITIPTTLPASDVYSWAKASTKPSYTYSEIGYGVSATSSAGGALSLAGTTPLHVITLNSAAVSGVTLSANPAAGHSCHIMFVNSTSADLTVDIAYDSTNRITPDAGTLTLTVPASNAGYAEVDFINVNSKIYVRGVGK